MTRSAIPLIAFALSLPITVRFSERDSAHANDPSAFAHHQPGTQLTVAGGAGTYGLVDRGCEGEVLRYRTVRHRDVAGEVEHRFPGPASLGIRGGLLHEELTLHEDPAAPFPIGEELPPFASRENHYANPYGRLDFPRIGMSAGGLYSTEPFVRSSTELMRTRFTAGLRFGTLNGASVRIGWMDALPLMADGGYFTFGVQISKWRDFELYVGASGAGPYDSGGLLARAHWWPSPITAVHLSGRVGGGTPVGEYGVTLGLIVRTPPPREPE